MEARDWDAFGVVFIQYVARLTLWYDKLAFIFKPIESGVTKLMCCDTSLVVVWFVVFGAGVNASKIEKYFASVASCAMADVIDVVTFWTAIWASNAYKIIC